MAPTPPTLAVWIVACAMSDAKFFTSRNWIKRGSFSPARGYERRAQNRRNRHQPSTRNEPMNPTTLSQARSAAHCVSIGRDGEGARSDGTTRPIDGRPRDPAGVFVRNAVLLGTAAGDGRASFLAGAPTTTRRSGRQHRPSRSTYAIRPTSPPSFDRRAKRPRRRRRQWRLGPTYPGRANSDK